MSTPSLSGGGTDRGNFVLKLTAKSQPLDLLGRHLGMFVTKHEASGPGGDPIKTTAIPADPQDAAQAYQVLMRGD